MKHTFDTCFILFCFLTGTIVPVLGCTNDLIQTKTFNLGDFAIGVMAGLFLMALSIFLVSVRSNYARNNKKHPR